MKNSQKISRVDAVRKYGKTREARIYFGLRSIRFAALADQDDSRVRATEAAAAHAEWEISTRVIGRLPRDVRRSIRSA